MTNTPAVPPTPTSGAEARRSVMEAIAEALRMVGLIDVAVESLDSSALDEYEASVRAEERAKVRAMVEGMQGYDTPQYDDIGMQESYSGHGEWLDRNEVLAGLAKLEGQ